MQYRNWREFLTYAFKSLKTVAISSLLVPIFFFLMNPNYHESNFFGNLLFSTRIGIQISIFCWLNYMIFYSVLYYINPSNLYKIKQSVKVQVSLGLIFMLVGLLLTSVFEPYISGRYFGLESISVGTLVGSTTFLLCLFYVAYKKTKEDYLNLSIESARSNLHILNNQMQPHFLFNSLNSLVELIESNNECAAQVAQNLADLYRQILKNSKNQVSSLESEISIINKYLELEKIRYEGRFSYNIVISIDILNSNEIQNIYLPSLILQTLVENAIKHGISKSLKGGEILIQVFRNEKLGFHISVTNSGCPFQYSNSKGTGLANTEARLSLLYGTKHNFIIESVDQKTIASFWFSGDAVGI